MKRKLQYCADIEYDLLCCNVCYKKFTETGDQSPRNLSCGHAYCLQCVNTILGNRNRLECPFCRTMTNFGRGTGPVSLPINNHIVRLLEMTDSSTRSTATSGVEIVETACLSSSKYNAVYTAMCMNCEDDSPSAAEWGCVECAFIFCNIHKSAHVEQKVFRNHCVVPTTEFRKRRSCMCDKHPSEEIKAMCNDCGVLVCDIGRSLFHSSHSILSLADTISRECMKLEQSLQTARSTLDSAKPKIEALTRMLVSNIENEKKLQEQVDIDTTQLMDAISLSAAALREDIKLQTAKTTARVEAEKLSVQDWSSRADNCISLSSRALVPDYSPSFFFECQVHHHFEPFSASL